MIVHLRGTLMMSGAMHVVLETGGVGYRVEVSERTSRALTEADGEVRLHIHSHYTETDQRLYGFLDTQEKAVFEHLITVKGVGPKLAVTILSGLDAASLRHAIRNQDIGRLCAIPGIGRKTAERMALELKEKLSAPEEGENHVRQGGTVTMDAAGSHADAVQALESLGYKRKEAERLVADIMDESPEADTGTVIRTALTRMTRS